jgi:hypothetical protein
VCPHSVHRKKRTSLSSAALSCLSHQKARLFSLFFTPSFHDLHLVVTIDLPDISTLPALELTCGRHHQAVAFRTEHRTNVRF